MKKLLLTILFIYCTTALAYAQTPNELAIQKACKTENTAILTAPDHKK